MEQLLFIELVEFVKSFAAENFDAAFFQRIEQRADNVAGVAAERDSSLVRRFVAADHDVFTCGLERKTVDFHQRSNTRFVVHKSNAFVTVATLAIQHFAQDFARRLLRPAERNLRTFQRQFHHGLQNQIRKFVETVFVLLCVTADDEVRFRALVIRPWRVERMSVNADEELLNQLLRMFARERAVRDTPFVKRIEILVRTPDAVGQERKTEIETLDRLLEALRGIHRDARAVARHAEQRRLPRRIFRLFRLLNAEIAQLSGAAADSADHHFQRGKIREVVRLAKKIPACGIDFTQVTVQSETDQFSEIGVRMLPLHRAEIFLRVVVITTQSLLTLHMTRPGENIGGNGTTVHTHHADEFVLLIQLDSLGADKVTESLCDGKGFREFIVEFIKFNADGFRVQILFFRQCGKSFNTAVHKNPPVSVDWRKYSRSFSFMEYPFLLKAFHFMTSGNLSGRRSARDRRGV